MGHYTRRLAVWKLLDEPRYGSVSNQGQLKWPDGTIRKPCLGANGYYYTQYYKRPVYLHDLVASAFIGKKPNGYTVNHKNGVKLDNRVENLEYLTRSENMLHAWATGLCDNVGESNGMSKLSVPQVKEIKTQLGLYTYKELSKKYNVSETAIADIKLGRTWTHVTLGDE